MPRVARAQLKIAGIKLEDEGRSGHARRAVHMTFKWVHDRDNLRFSKMVREGWDYDERNKEFSVDFPIKKLRVLLTFIKVRLKLLDKQNDNQK